jgi:transcription antitermination factor NusG
MSDWVILRTSGRHTLRLAETLSEDGLEAWTPVETRNIRIPRANVRRTVQLPIMPSYVFARAHNLIDLIQLSALRPIPRRVSCRPCDRGEEWRPYHADFSVMRYHDRIPVIADGHLQSLRTIEAKRAPKKRGTPLMPGLSVRVKQEGGSFAGMKGRVERSDEGSTLVCFDNRLTVKIATALLDASEIVDLRKAA